MKLFRPSLCLATIWLLSFTAQAHFEYQTIRHGWTGTKIRIGFHSSLSTDKANVLFFHGYADRMENHLKLFKQLRKKGLRVLSFDYPGHGESGGWLSTWDLKDVAEISKSVLKETIADSQKPLILMGWSTGGTIVARILQSWKSSVIPREHEIGGAVMIAPGIPVQLLVGDTAIVVSSQSLTRGRLEYGPSPSTTLGGGIFTASLAKQSAQARFQGELPDSIPVAVFLGDNEADKYVNTPSAVKWYQRDRQARKPLFGFQCPGGYHGLEFEPEGIGKRVRDMAVQFSKKMSLASANSRLQKTDALFQKLSRESSACPAIH